MHEVFVERRVVNFVKLSVTAGDKCLCKISDDEYAKLTFYAERLPRGAALMALIDFGETVVEWSIMRSVGNIDIPINPVYSSRCFGEDVEYCVLNIDDHAWRSFAAAH
jgi:hypothetical protein